MHIFCYERGKGNSLWWEALMPLTVFKPGGEERSVVLPGGV